MVDKSKMALQAENKTFLSRFFKSEINTLMVSESEAISSLITRETREAAPVISAARRAIGECMEDRRVGSKARMGVTEEEEDLERRREG